MSELLLGCGHSREKRMMLPGQLGGWSDLVTLDSNPDCKSDIVCDLDQEDWIVNNQPSNAWIEDCYHVDENDDGYWTNRLRSEIFSEVHAYEVLEHLGRQGDVSSFFNTFDNIYRILRPNGHLLATCPSRFSHWLWGDPGHCRAILPESLVFLDQTSYKQCGITMMSDYRGVYKSDFKIVSSTDDRQFHRFILQAIKPARIV